MPTEDLLQKDLFRQKLLAGNLILASCSVFYNNLKIILLGFLKPLRLFPIISLCIDVPWMLYTQWALYRAYKKGLISKAEYAIGATAEGTSSLVMNIAMAGQVVSAVALGLAGPILFVVGFGISFFYALTKWIVHYKEFREGRESLSAEEYRFQTRQLKIGFCMVLAYLGATITLATLLLHPIGMMVSGGLFVLFNVTNLLLNYFRPIAILTQKPVQEHKIPELDVSIDHSPALVHRAVSSKASPEIEYIPTILTVRSLCVP